MLSSKFEASVTAAKDLQGTELKWITLLLRIETKPHLEVRCGNLNELQNEQGLICFAK